MKILNSASRIVFILIALAVIAGLFIGKVDAKDFFVLAGMVFTYFFTNKTTGNDPLEGK